VNSGSTAGRGRASGFSDWLGGTAARRQDLAAAFVNAFQAWGYDLVATPLVETLETVAVGVGAPQQAQLFRFVDSDGTLLALVGERTVSVARAVAGQLQGAPFPLRLCYAGPVLRNAPLLGGRRRESLQAGCELIGHGGLTADAECIALAAAALERGGVEGAHVDVGHADFVPGLLESAGLPPETQERVRNALTHRDLVAVEAALQGTEIAEAERRLLLAFPTLRGGREILDTAAAGLGGERPRRALADLATLWDVLEGYGISTRIHLDLGAVRDWDYYTGVIFEVFSAKSGFPLGNGGRYDSLLGRFGFDAPAAGFVLHVDRCLGSVAAAEPAGSGGSVVRITWSPGSHHQAVQCARRMRDAGIAASCDLEPSEAFSAGASVHVDGTRARWGADGASAEGSYEAAVAAILEATR